MTSITTKKMAKTMAKTTPNSILVPGNRWKLYGNESGRSRQLLWSYRETYHLKYVKTTQIKQNTRF